MKIPIIILFILFLTLTVQSQTYEVLNVKKAVDGNGKKIRKKDELASSETISIKADGMLALKVETTMPMKLGPGTYHLRTEANRHEEWYDTHLELTQLLKKENLISCKFRYKTLAVPGTNRPYEVDRIELDQEGLTRIKSDTSQLEISWYNPDLNYQGSYFIVVRDYYNQGFIDVIEAKGDKAILYPGRYGHRHMYYSIIARNCRASLRYKIEVLSDNAVSSRHFTNFIEFESH